MHVCVCKSNNTDVVYNAVQYQVVVVCLMYSLERLFVCVPWVLHKCRSAGRKTQWVAKWSIPEL